MKITLENNETHELDMTIDEVKKKLGIEVEMDREQIIVKTKLFHDTYEQLAPQFGYETRPDTKEFDPNSPNGQLMRAVVEKVLADVSAERDAEEWNLIYTEKDNPTELGWYLVSVLEMNTLGAFRYTDIISFGHRAEIGNCWFIQSDKQRVVAWKSRPDPYKGEQ